MCARGEHESLEYQQLLGWKRATATFISQDDDAVAGRKSINEVFPERIYMKWSGSNYEQFRIDISNGRVPKSRERTHDISEAHMKMEYFNPVLAQTKKIEEIKGSQHTQIKK